MHGIIKPHPSQDAVKEHWSDTLRGWAYRNKWFVLVVLVPTLLVAAYYYVFASDQYQSEAHFIVRTADSSPMPSAGFSQLLGLGGGASQSRSEAMSVNDYLDSQQAVIALNRRVNLVERFRRPEADIATRLWHEQPTPEMLMRYYRKQVNVRFNQETGITTLRVRAFRPADSYAIINQLLAMGEERVNILNRRSQGDALKNARRQLAEAEQALLGVQSQLTAFRQQRGDLDPEGSGRAQLGLVTSLQGQLTNARAQLNAMRGIIAPSSPQYVATAARVRALEAQVAGQTGKLTSGGGAIAARLGNYQDLQIRQEFAGKRYEVAAANLEKARDAAMKQQLYIVRVVDPNLPVKSEFPERGKMLLTVFLSLMIAYGIGWLLAAGVREHSL
ncbi:MULTISPECIES: lipopolysaccharide biosynthesis protein [unclassified Sphingomonas]|uniref:lipopolysaccharide biosynthesis protein n=1 Tax=unclassified Sphingomonas TaxID=196159 RepID=UPI0006FB48ED|nr:MULTISPECIES: lipopolysaccharide biosynthesis protein [unclassified Sphingomonas]KQX22737.1 lipopolysaccharide biosynthesis protein [Sphingomonas sp. Root1294]KQY67784.1 lipopolysaccharide biosynthesis protein [Sphingomonas sp. Root50]KRB88706.1 lipopolysaccharide biosynthesis protein [Sphingomonas sp. Root720]